MCISHWGFQKKKFEMQWCSYCKILRYNFKNTQAFKLYRKAFAVCNYNQQITRTVQNSKTFFSVSTSIPGASSSFLLRFQLNKINRSKEVERIGYLLWMESFQLWKVATHPKPGQNFCILAMSSKVRTPVLYKLQGVATADRILMWSYGFDL